MEIKKVFTHLGKRIKGHIGEMVMTCFGEGKKRRIGKNNTVTSAILLQKRGLMFAKENQQNWLRK